MKDDEISDQTAQRLILAYMKENFELRIETMHVADDKGNIENVHQLDEKLLQKRKVVSIDIADDRLQSKRGEEGQDFRSFRHEACFAYDPQTGRPIFFGKSIWVSYQEK